MEKKKEIRKYKRGYFGMVKTRKGYDAIWVGGGAYSNTAIGRFLLPLRTPFFIRHHGQLACNEQQALVSVEVGDIIVLFSGLKDKIGNDYEEDNGLRAFKILNMNEIEVEVEVINLSWEEIPGKVKEGLKIYHNRYGGYFCRD